MELREIAMKVVDAVQHAGNHAFQEQATARNSFVYQVPSEQGYSPSPIDQRLRTYLETKLAAINTFDGFWDRRPENWYPGQRIWCVGGIDGVINYMRNMSEWTVTVSLFEFNEFGSAQPIIGVVHAPALYLTYVAARNCGAIRLHTTPTTNRRERIMPSTTASLDGSVISYGMSFIPSESKRAMLTVAALAGRPADIKRVGPVSLDLCKVADGTYDAYFEPHLHKWDVPAVSAGTVVVWESQGHVRQWNDELIHWRQDNDVVATNGQLDSEIFSYLK